MGYHYSTVHPESCLGTSKAKSGLSGDKPYAGRLANLCLTAQHFSHVQIEHFDIAKTLRAEVDPDFGTVI